MDPATRAAVGAALREYLGTVVFPCPEEDIRRGITSLAVDLCAKYGLDAVAELRWQAPGAVAERHHTS